jgi:uncharacterized cupredoxin-like copper-binding protein
MNFRAVLYSFLLAGLCTGFAYAEEGYDDPTLDWLPQHIDWETAEVVTVLLEDNIFTPDEITLRQNKPYKIILNNISDSVVHDFVDPSLFHAVVFQKLTVGGTTITTPHIHNVKLRPNNQASLYLVPVKAGEYEIFCSIPGHQEDGMEGYVTVLPDEGGTP